MKIGSKIAAIFANISNITRPQPEEIVTLNHFITALEETTWCKNYGKDDQDIFIEMVEYDLHSKDNSVTFKTAIKP